MLPGSKHHHRGTAVAGLLLAAALTATLLATASPAWGLATDARALAMGNAYSAVADEADMAAWNPALLGLHDEHSHWLALTAPSVNLGVGNDFLSLQDLLSLLPDAKGNPQTLSQANLTDLLAELPQTGWHLAVDSGARAAIASPALGTSLSLETDVDVQGVGLPHDLVQFLLEGNTNTPQVDISQLKGATATAIAAAGLSQGFPVPSLFGKRSAVGITVKYLQGLAYGTVTAATGSLLSRDSVGQLSASASLEYQTASPTSLAGLTSTGSGVAVDLGFINQLTDELRWGLTLGNLGFIKWNHVQDHIEAISQPPFGANLPLSGKAALPNFNGDVTQATGSADGTSGVDGHLPPYARVGLAWNGMLTVPSLSRRPDARPQFAMPLLVSLDVQEGFGNGYGISTQPELRMGLEARPFGHFLPLRLGGTIGGALPMAGAGFGLDFDRFKLDLAMGTMFGFFNDSTKGLYGTVTTTFAL